MTGGRTLGRCPSCRDLGEPVSLATMPAGGQRQANTEDGGEATTGKETSKSHRDLAGGGRGGGAALGSYRQSGGANGTRKTWGALVGETGRSHLTSSVSLGHSLGLRGRGRGHGDISRLLEKRLFGSLGPETHAPPPGSRESGSAISRDEKQPPESSGPSPVLPALSEPLAGAEAPMPVT